jgi:hypothetical protein
MNRRQRIADMDMAYLGKAWRLGFEGPRESAKGTSLWQQILEQIRSLPPTIDQERLWTLHATWLRVADQDEYSAAILKLCYRDGYKIKERERLDALDLFGRMS